MHVRKDVQTTKFQCLFIKRRKPNGDTCQVVIGPSLLRWILILILVIILLLRGENLAQVLWSLLCICAG
jgi:hypothetical protein